jgi:hypothetical protein
MLESTPLQIIIPGALPVDLSPSKDWWPELSLGCKRMEGLTLIGLLREETTSLAKTILLVAGGWNVGKKKVK